MAVRVESQAEPIPGYRLIERLGGGGFGEVWKAEAPGGLFKAIKFVYGELDSAGGDSERAEQELKAIKRVQSVRHPYILSLERYDIIDGQLIIVMELADKNLWDRFKECRAEGLPGIPREELLGYVAESAEALDLMNGTYQLQHLDIKPQNLFLVHNHVKVADFGLVKDLEGMAASVTGGVTPVYAAPETFDGWVSRFSDQYSLAIVYQELLTGVRPFAGNNIRQLVLQHLQGAPNLASLSAADRPAIAPRLAKNPSERHPTCQDMVRTLTGATPTVAVLELPLPDVPGSADTPQETRPPDAEPAPSPHTPSRTLNLPRAPVPPASAPATPVTSNQTSQRPMRWVGSAPEQAMAPPTPASRPPTASATADGTLFPALVVGVGGAGLAVLRRLRQSLNALLPGDGDLAHLRLLYVDTDPDAARSATRGRPETCLGPGEVLLTRLNRPSHYLKPRDGRPAIDAWFDPKMLYRIPRSQTTAGCRALGRLAFCDNYRFIAPRLRAELEACLDPELIEAAARQTRLGLRTSRPRAYVVASLAGGSGGGMFLDLAYVTRATLRDLGHADAELIGVFLLPPADRAPANPLPLGNACAALAELGHFCRGGEFSARYAERDNPLRDAAPPFTRCVLLPLVPGPEAPADEAAAPAAEFLARDLCTGLGRAADQARTALTLPAGASCQTFGLYKLAFPRRELVARAGRRLGRTLVERWMSKDGGAVREAVEAWVAEHWSREEHGPEGLIERLQADCERALGYAPDRLFGQIIEPASGRAALDPVAVADVLAGLEEQVGRPGEGSMADQPARLHELLRGVCDKVVDEWGGKLGGLIVRLIESPPFRLAGAEEAIRHIVALLQKVLEHHEPLARELATRADDAHGRIRTLVTRLGQPGAGKSRQLPAPSEVQELLRCFAKWRYQGLVLQQVTRGLVSLRGLLSDELREVNFCRTRLAELNRAFTERPEETADRGESPVPGRTLFPGGCATLDAAAEQVFQAVSAEQLAALDERVQATIRQQFTALVHVCLTSANMLRNLEIAMQEQAEATVKGSLSSLNAAELFFAELAADEAAEEAVRTAYAEAAPEMTSRGGEVCVLVVPQGPAGGRFRDLARRVLREVALLVVVGGDDVLFYREASNVLFADLEQLGPIAREAYGQLVSRQHFTPHSRADIRFAV